MSLALTLPLAFAGAAICAGVLMFWVSAELYAARRDADLDPARLGAVARLLGVTATGLLALGLATLAPILT